jgi:hypothetical protein
MKLTIRTGVLSLIVAVGLLLSAGAKAQAAGGADGCGVGQAIDVELGGCVSGGTQPEATNSVCIAAPTGAYSCWVCGWMTKLENLTVNQHPILTPDRRPILTPSAGCPGSP